MSKENIFWIAKFTAIAVMLMAITAGSATAFEPEADIDGSGFVDSDDLFKLQANWHQGTPYSTPLVDTPTPTSTPTSPEAQQTISIDLGGGVTMEMVKIPAGSFQMGSNDSWSYSDEQPVHTVNIGYDFYMGKYEVTQAQWEAVMGNNPSYFSSCGGNCPVEEVSWNDCQEFITELNKLGQGTFRLPSEAEWEYACRAGTTTRFYFGDSNCEPTGCNSCDLDSYGWWCGKAGVTTHPVGQKLVNPFGLYDMHGNVWEWCQDWYHSSYTGAPTDGSAWESPTGSYRVVRGGNWNSNARDCRSSFRSYYSPDIRYILIGLRLVRLVP